MTAVIAIFSENEEPDVSGFWCRNQAF